MKRRKQLMTQTLNFAQEDGCLNTRNKIHRNHKQKIQVRFRHIVTKNGGGAKLSKYYLTYTGNWCGQTIQIVLKM